jgi:S-adenosyl methyltransferase
VTSDGAASTGRTEPEIDTARAHGARIYDYLLGGQANVKVDQEAAERAYAAWPGGIDAVRSDVRAHRAALGRVVRYFAHEAGITQFLDIGTGIPGQGSVHEVAKRELPGARVVYVDRDPVVLAHARQLLRGTAEGAVRYVYGDLPRACAPGQRPALRRVVRDIQPAELGHGRLGHAAQPRRGGRAAQLAGPRRAWGSAGHAMAARPGDGRARVADVV